uniref:ABC-type glutathione-S-conjugate transporter n=2 Tax=Tetranychus urticae TaxID=32264 RepID=T1K6F1_TETUR
MENAKLNSLAAAAAQANTDRLAASVVRSLSPGSLNPSTSSSQTGSPNFNHKISGIPCVAAASRYTAPVHIDPIFVLIDSSNILDANKAFVSLSLFNILRIPLALLPMVVSYGANFIISIKRINKYLQGDEIDPETIQHEPNPHTPVVLRNGTFSWSKDDSSVLNGITLDIKDKSLVAIVGQVGSGKSSLLSALLGDLYKTEGYVNVYGKIAYVPQSAWIQNATVRQNITFSQPYIEEKYNKVLEACALTQDLKILTGGDLTEIGEKGINLSGGQKQRVSLARAVYANSDIYFLDDPLSAVDAHVSRHLFDKVIGPTGMLKKKTRILVTHRVTFLPQVDEIIVLKDGQITEQGTYHELLAKNGEFAQFLLQFVSEQHEELAEEDKEIIEQLKEKMGPEFEKRGSIVRSETLSNSSDGIRRRTMSNASRPSTKKGNTSRSMSQLREEPESTKGNGEKFKLVETEVAQTGKVKWGVYWEFFKACGLVSCLLVILAFCLSSTFNLLSSLWLTEWSNDSLNPAAANDTTLRNIRLGVYFGLGLSETTFTLTNSIILNFAILKGARLIHEKMLHRMIRAPMSFYDTTPLGRILNRFTKDIDVADVTLTFNIRLLISQSFRAIVAIIAICLETPYFLLVVIPIGFAYIFVQKFYISSSRQLKRIESVTRSPVYSHFSETVSGATSIRAYDCSERFINECYHRVDINHSSYFPNLGSNRWLAVRLEFLGNLIVFLAAIFAVTSRGTLSPGYTGLSVSYALTVTQVLNMLVRAVSDVETNVVSVERCLEYTKTPMEAPWDLPHKRTSSNWPDNGQIEFKNYSTRYRPGLDLVLKDISCTIKPNEKVGIVGRTGAGKSSLTLALFRIIEPSGGRIEIDDQDISQLGLHNLRSRLTVIPQDPVLFSGSFRRNFDPFEKHTDSDIWKALELSHLKGFVDSLESGLNYEIAEGGENLSVGQKQLVCLTRALLRKSKVLVLDEATAAVDIETDELIQGTIRKEFSDCTIVTIAHRLNTIMDYDRIIVMDKGTIVEFDSPANLLKDTKSIFYSMAREANLI